MKKFWVAVVGLVLSVSVMCWADTDELTEKLKDEPGIFVKDITGHIHEIDIRGFSNTDVLVLVDGRRTNCVDLSGTDWGQISLDQVDKIEITKCDGAVLFGDNATGGVINITTKKGKTEEPKIDFNSYMGSYGYYANSIGISGLNDNLDYSFRYRYKREDGYRENSSARVKNLGLNTGYNFDNYTLRFEAGRYDGEYGLPGAITRSQMDEYGRRWTRYPNDKVKVSDWFIRPVIEVENLDLSISYRERDYEYKSTNWISNSQISMLQPDLNYEWKTDINRLKIGIDYLDNLTKVKDSSSKFKLTKNSLGTYFYNVLTLSSFEINSGYRHQEAKYDFGETDKKAIENVFCVGVNYLVTDKSNIYLNWGEGFRFPATDEYYSVWSGLNTDLKHQQSKTYEVGGEYNEIESLKLVASIYEINTKNEIYYDPYNWVNSNLPKTQRQGLELSSNYELNKIVSLWVNYGYEKARIKATKKYIPMVPKSKVSGGIDLGFRKIKLFTKVNYIGKRYFLNDLKNESVPMKPYITCDLGLIYGYKNERAKIEVGCDNIFDKRYSDLGVKSGSENYYYPVAGRTIYSKLSLVF